MPLYTTHQHNKEVTRYGTAARGQGLVVIGNRDAVDAARREAVFQREYWQQQQRAAGRDNVDLARYAKEEVRRHHRAERAGLIVLRYVDGLPTDPVGHWPHELVEELDRFMRLAAD